MTNGTAAIRREFVSNNDAINLPNDSKKNILARLQHPRILQYLGVQNAPDSVLIFMEFMPGGSVKDLIKEQGRLATRLALKYTAQV